MRSIIAATLVALTLTTCATAPAYTQETQCLSPSMLREVISAQRVLDGMPGNITLVEQMDLDNTYVTVYFDGMIEKFVVVPFDGNWCANGPAIFLTVEDGKRVLDVEVPTN